MLQQSLLEKYFSREGKPQFVVTDNGRHFSADLLMDCVKSVGSQIIFIGSRHIQSNGFAENFVRTVKSAIKTNDPKAFESLDKVLINFLF